jgi:antitoxin component of MazEF toxin-antitoxin module
MPFPTKVQVIERANSQQFYINFPAAVAQALDFEKGEIVEWTIHDKRHLILRRTVVPPDPIEIPSAQKKTPR